MHARAFACPHPHPHPIKLSHPRSARLELVLEARLAEVVSARRAQRLVQDRGAEAARKLAQRLLVLAGLFAQLLRLRARVAAELLADGRRARPAPLLLLGVPVPVVALFHDSPRSRGQAERAPWVRCRGSGARVLQRATPNAMQPRASARATAATPQRTHHHGALSISNTLPLASAISSITALGSGPSHGRSP